MIVDCVVVVCCEIMWVLGVQFEVFLFDGLVGDFLVGQCVEYFGKECDDVELYCVFGNLVYFSNWFFS